MTEINRHHSVRRLMFATALPAVLLAEGAAPALAGSVTVTGANGASGGLNQPGGPGGGATATTTTPSDPSNSAAATGGAGGTGGFANEVGIHDRGGFGGSATSTATTTVQRGSASALATATSIGGAGGFGGVPAGPGGNGGAASSTATASNTNGSASATATSTGGKGGRGGLFSRCCGAGPPGAGGDASVVASARSGGGGLAQAAASSFGGGTFLPLPGPKGGGASASAAALNSDDKALTTASAPNGSSSSALTNAAVGSGSASLVAITAGRAVSTAILTPGGQFIGVGAMSAGYGGSSAALQYEATAVFDFTAPTSEALDLKLLSDDFAVSSVGIGFDSLDLQVVNETTGRSLASFSFTSSSAAEKLFNADPVISLGSIGEGSQSVEVEYLLGYNSGTSAGVGDGFGFTYDLATAPVEGADYHRLRFCGDSDLHDSRAVDLGDDAVGLHRPRIRRLPGSRGPAVVKIRAVDKRKRKDRHWKRPPAYGAAASDRCSRQARPAAW